MPLKMAQRLRTSSKVCCRAINVFVLDSTYDGCYTLAYSKKTGYTRNKAYQIMRLRHFEL